MAGVPEFVPPRTTISTPTQYSGITTMTPAITRLEAR
jgi:hypothetical protein